MRKHDVISKDRHQVGISNFTGKANLKITQFEFEKIGLFFQWSNNGIIFARNLS